MEKIFGFFKNDGLDENFDFFKDNKMMGNLNVSKDDKTQLIEFFNNDLKSSESLEKKILLTEKHIKHAKSQEQFDESVESYNALLASVLDKMPVSVSNVFLKILNYDGLILGSDLYLDFFKLIFSKDEHYYNLLSNYIINHNNAVKDLRKCFSDADLSNLKNYLIDTINDKKLLTEFLESCVYGKKYNLSLVSKFYYTAAAATIVREKVLKEVVEFEDKLLYVSDYRSITKLLNFINGSSLNNLNSKHFSIFNSLIDVTEDEMKFFELYSKLVDKILIEEEITKKEKILNSKKNIVPTVKKEVVVDNESVYYDIGENEEVEEEILECSKNIFANILAHNPLEYMIEILPKSGSLNFYKIKNDLDFLISMEEDIIKSLIVESDSIEDDLLQDLLYLSNESDFLDDYFYGVSDDLSDDLGDDLSDDQSNVFIHFALRNNNTPFVFPQFEKLTPAEKSRVEYLLNYLKSGSETFDVTRQRKIKSANSKLFELKHYQSRLLCKPLYGKNVLVLGFYIKKSNNDVKIFKAMIEREILCVSQASELTLKIKNNELTEEYINMQEKFLNDCYDLLSTDKKILKKSVKKIKI